MIRVFLSYAREDQGRVEILYQNLKAAGFQPWMDVHELEPGEEWEKAIHRGVHAADCFLACISRHSINKGGALGDEIRLGVDRWRKRRGNYRLIPIRLEDCEIPESLKPLQWHDLFHDEDWTVLPPVIRKRRRMHMGIAVAACVLLMTAVWWFLPRWTPGPMRIGVTVWRLRQPTAADLPGSKMLVHVHPPGGAPLLTSLVPERVAYGTPLAEGQLIRVGVESAQPGFLYIVDREQLGGGRIGSPKLIYPTKQIRNGQNDVAPGVLVNIPYEADEGLRITKENEGYQGELLSIIFSRQRVNGLEPGDDASDLDEGWFRTKLAEWETEVSRTESQSGIAATPSEIDAGKSMSKQLTRRDPLPQSIFSCKPRRGMPAVVSFPIRLAPRTARGRSSQAEHECPGEPGIQVRSMARCSEIPGEGSWSPRATRSRSPLPAAITVSYQTYRTRAFCGHL